MNIFKNGVGRPSNEIKKKRKIFVASIISVIVLAIILVVTLLSRSNILSGILRGAKTYSVSYGLANVNTNDVTIKSYPSYKSHTGSLRFPVAPSYTVKNGKTCTFKGWIIQRTSDGRYRVKNLNTGKNAWYSSKLDGNIKWEYNYLKSGTLSVGSNAKLYAAFDCKNTSSSSSNSTASKKTFFIKFSSKYDVVTTTDQVYDQAAVTGTMEDQIVAQHGTINTNRFALDGHTMQGWKAYRIINGTKKYFVKGKGWTGTSESSGTLISNGASLSSYNIPNHTGDGSTIYLVAQWKKLTGKSGYYTIVFKNYNPNSWNWDHWFDGEMKNQELQKSNGAGSALNKNKFVGAGLYKKFKVFDGWKAYRIIDGRRVYFVKGKGWVGKTPFEATTIEDREKIQDNKGLNIDKYTSAGEYIFMEATWYEEGYVITYAKELNGITLVNAKSAYVAKNGKLAINTYVKSGYKFKGWKLRNSSSSYYYTDKGFVGTEKTAKIIPAGTKLSSLKNFHFSADINAIAVWEKR